MKRQYLIIAADFWADLGKRFVSLTLFDLLIFKEGDCLSNLLWMSAVEQAPSILLSPFAGLLVDRIGPDRCLAGTLVCKCLLFAALILSILPKAVIAIYLLFICTSLLFTIAMLTIIPLLVPGNRLISFNALNERVAISGAVAPANSINAGESKRFFACLKLASQKFAIDMVSSWLTFFHWIVQILSLPFSILLQNVDIWIKGEKASTHLFLGNIGTIY